MSLNKREKSTTTTSKYFDESDNGDSKRSKLNSSETDANSKKSTLPLLFDKEWKLISEMRSKRDAPVDSQGTECCGDRSASPSVFRYQTLISLMLSSQTKDEITSAAMTHLKDFGLTPQHIRDTSEEVIQELIKPVGFYRRKATYIKKSTEIILDDYNGDIPKTINDLMKLPGVGPKMGYLCLKCAWNIVDGIGVDVHVHRICNRLQWVKSNTAEETRKQLEEWLPREYWSDINLLLVGFGQQICKSNPKCDHCSLRKMCPSEDKIDIEDLFIVCY